MRNATYTIENWQLVTAPNSEVKAKNFSPLTIKNVLDAGYSPIKASVPGNFELDLMRENIIPDLYYGTNVHLAKRLENLHLYYFTNFSFAKKTGADAFLTFNGIDTVAEIFIDGKFFAFVENMLHAHTFPINDLSDGNHELLVHILPVSIYARQFDIPAMCFGLPYNHDSLNVRKAPHMFGWDIMPRIVSGGIYKTVEVSYLPKVRIENPFTATKSLSDGVATLITSFDVVTDEDYIFDYSVTIKGTCKDHTFSKTFDLFNVHIRKLVMEVENPYLWWPKNHGEQNLYDFEITLFHKGVEVDKVTYKTGIRTAFLRRSSIAGDNGDFCFIINNKRIFCTGTNWVPTDAFPSRHKDYDLRGLELVKNSNCNMIRCWGGNCYPSTAVYDYCDENGIMIWQDFAFGCAHYPDSKRLCDLVEEEVKQVAITYRNHPSLVLYAGDNECDSFVCTTSKHGELDNTAWLNPNFNTLTRSVILKTLRNHDATRPYLPSSPYIDQTAYLYGEPTEDHLWGSRDYFKGDFYKNPNAHFASEIGYHGCPSPKSLEKFIPKESLNDWGDTKICSNLDWLAHATAMETKPDDWYVYRISLMTQQVDRIFTYIGSDLDTYARQSQISQAEAVKYFIEHFRSCKWRKSGLLWWNVIDGWPQISDAVVDWYGVKKLAYHYITRSQEPFIMLVKEPADGKMELVACNDYPKKLTVKYTVKNLMDESNLLSGSFEIEPDSKITVDFLPSLDHAFYYIEWETELKKGRNHHTCSIGDKWKFEDYIFCMKKAGFYDEFEGF